VAAQVRHHKRGRHLLAGDVADDEPESVAAEAEEVMLPIRYAMLMALS